MQFLSFSWILHQAAFYSRFAKHLNVHILLPIFYLLCLCAVRRSRGLHVYRLYSLLEHHYTCQQGNMSKSIPSAFFLLFSVHAKVHTYTLYLQTLLWVSDTLCSQSVFTNTANNKQKTSGKFYLFVNGIYHPQYTFLSNFDRRVQCSAFMFTSQCSSRTSLKTEWPSVDSIYEFRLLGVNWGKYQNTKRAMIKFKFTRIIVLYEAIVTRVNFSWFNCQMIFNDRWSQVSLSTETIPSIR